MIPLKEVSFFLFPFLNMYLNKVRYLNMLKKVCFELVLFIIQTIRALSAASSEVSNVTSKPEFM